MKENLILLATKVKLVEDKEGHTEQDVEGDLATIISRIILALGIVAVIVIIIGGVSYMTSTGDAGKVKKAKDTILYGVIGLIICALAFAIVNFVVNIINQTN